MPVFAAVLLALTLLVAPVQIQAATRSQHWALTDSAGHLWGLNLFEQPDPAYPAGWRLRLTARSPGQRVDHMRPLLLSDGLGSGWTLPVPRQAPCPVATNKLAAAAGLICP